MQDLGKTRRRRREEYYWRKNEESSKVSHQAPPNRLLIEVHVKLADRRAQPGIAERASLRSLLPIPQIQAQLDADRRGREGRRCANGGHGGGVDFGGAAGLENVAQVVALTCPNAQVPALIWITAVREDGGVGRGRIEVTFVKGGPMALKVSTASPNKRPTEKEVG